MIKEELEKENAELKYKLSEIQKRFEPQAFIDLMNEVEKEYTNEQKIKELEKELEQAKKVKVVEHFEAYGQSRDSRRIAVLEEENAELKENLEYAKAVMREVLDNATEYSRQIAEDFIAEETK